ncbi:phosphate acyltransferase [Aliiroseovarius marinus]|uniref:phosphate acyltransferase n=1 Tax=Aliiroseovarius marinus TaxID=2500159 RepID=UPI003D7DED45
MTRPLDRAYEIARQRQARVVLPEMDDPRIAEAARRLSQEGLAVPVPVADANNRLTDQLVAQRGMRAAIAGRLLNRPLIRAAAMVGAGQADLLVAGAVAPTRRVIEAASLAIGIEPGIDTVSSFFLMDFPDGRAFLFADCAVNVDPDETALADIATATARRAEALLGHADVALLSFSTGHSGAGATVEKMRAVAQRTGFTGPVQADAALDPATAQQKGCAGGDANVLIFPNLDAGNIAYKLMVQLAGARAYGPILQGFRAPICDLSRGASVDEIVNGTILAIACASSA